MINVRQDKRYLYVTAAKESQASIKGEKVNGWWIRKYVDMTKVHKIKIKWYKI